MFCSIKLKSPRSLLPAKPRWIVDGASTTSVCARMAGEAFKASISGVNFSWVPF